jgi:hypothetical protein
MIAISRGLLILLGHFNKIFSISNCTCNLRIDLFKVETIERRKIYRKIHIDSPREVEKVESLIKSIILPSKVVSITFVPSYMVGNSIEKSLKAFSWETSAQALLTLAQALLDSFVAYAKANPSSSTFY